MTWHHASRRHRRRRHRQFGAGHVHGFGPWGRRGRFFGPGEVRLALLSLVGEGSRHGYELMKALEERSGGTYRASAGSVYPTLQQLEDEGLVRSSREQGKRVYGITEAGRLELEREAEAVESIWRRADDWGSWGGLYEPEAAELVRPAMLLVKSGLRAMSRSRDPQRVDDVRAIFQRARRELDALDD